jgi:hypothetical protein
MAHFILNYRRHNAFLLSPDACIDPNGNFDAVVAVKYFCGADSEKPNDFGYEFTYYYQEMGTDYRIVIEDEYDDLVTFAAEHGDTFDPNNPQNPVRVTVAGLGDDVALCYRECERMRKAFEALMGLGYFKLGVTF